MNDNHIGLGDEFRVKVPDKEPQDIERFEPVWRLWEMHWRGKGRRARTNLVCSRSTM